MRKDDPRYLEEDEALEAGREVRYLHRKPSKKAKQEYAVKTLVGQSPVAGLLDSPALRQVAATGLVAASPRLIRSIPRIIKAASAAQVSAGALSGWLGISSAPLGASGLGILAAAGLGSYFTTKYLMERFSKGRRQDEALKAYLKSRRAMAAALGRPLTSAELKALNAHYQQVVRELQTSKF